MFARVGQGGLWPVRKDGQGRTVMRVILTDMRCVVGEVTERSDSEWMVLQLGLCEDVSARMIDAVKEFLEKMGIACRN